MRPLDIFAGLSADILDLAAIAELHRARGLRVVVMEAGREPAGALSFTYDDETDPAAMMVELLRWAALGQALVRAGAATPHRPCSYVVREQRLADRALLSALGAWPTPASQDPGPPEAVEV